MPSSSSGDGDGNNSNSKIMTDSHVLRLIRRYDPVGSTTTGIKPGRSLENTRGAWNTVASNSTYSLPSNLSSSTCSLLPQRTLSTTHEDNGSVRQSSIPRLQRQRAFHEQERSPSPNVSNSIRPILKYTLPASRAEFNVQSKKTEPLTIEIEPHVPPSVLITNENAFTYQPLITTGTKRVCAAISKSERDLRLQHDPPSPIAPHSPSTFPIRPSSSRTTINQQQEKESYRPLLSRSISSIGINNTNEHDDDFDDFDENSAPIIVGSCVEKLKQIFTPKSSIDSTNLPLNKQHRFDSIESNLNRSLNTNGTNINKSDLFLSTSSLIQKQPNSNSIESQTRTIPNGNLTKPTTIIQEDLPSSSPLLKRPILRSQKTLNRYVKISFAN